MFFYHVICTILKYFLQNTKSNDFIYIFHMLILMMNITNYCSLSCITPKNSSTIFSFVSINRIETITYCLLCDRLPPPGCFQGALPPLPLCCPPLPLPKLACCCCAAACGVVAT